MTTTQSNDGWVCGLKWVSSTEALVMEAAGKASRVKRDDQGRVLMQLSPARQAAAVATRTRKITYRVTLPDGRVVTRKSHRTYTHAVAILFVPYNSTTGERTWSSDPSFCGSLALAQKRAAAGRLPGDECRILPVEVA